MSHAMDRPGRFLLCAALVVGASLPIFAKGGSDPWVAFSDESSTRVPAPWLTDNEEKDFAWGDVDQDGDDDLVVARKQPFTSSGRRANVLLMNEDGIFVDQTSAFASASSVPGDQGFLTPTNDRDIQLVDLNGDGWLDIITATTLSDGQPKHISHPRVYVNLGDDAQGDWLGFMFEDDRIPEMECCNGSNPHAPRFCSVAFGDLDSDGDQDLYFGDYDSGGGQTLDFNNRILINNGSGFFTDETDSRLTFEQALSAFGAATEIFDMNNDGQLDVVKQTALNPPQHVAITYNSVDDPGQFDDNSPGSSADYEIIYQNAPYFVDVGDLNNDGLMDLVVVDDFADRVMINTGIGSDGNADFTDYVFDYDTGGDTGFGGNALIADWDNDGFNDVYITDVDVDISGCNRFSTFYHNQGDPPMVTLTQENGTSGVTPQGVHDVAAMDVNGDGWLDLVLGTCDGMEVHINQPPVGANFSYPGGLPTFVPPFQTSTIQVLVQPVNTTLEGSLIFLVGIDGGPLVPGPVLDLGFGAYEVTVPATACVSRLDFSFAHALAAGSVESDPPTGTYSAIAALGLLISDSDDIEGSTSDWIVSADPEVTAGNWEAADPVGTIYLAQEAAPEDDATPGPGVTCWVTQNGEIGEAVGDNDLDGGFVRLTTPAYDFAGTDGTIAWSQWFFSSVSNRFLTIEVSNDTDALGNGTWVLVENFTGNTQGWADYSFLVSDHVTPNDNVRVRFSAADDPNIAIVEVGIDDVVVSVLDCGSGEPQFSRGDVNADGSFGLADALALLNHLFSMGATPPCLDAADGDDSGALGLPDGIAVLSALFGSPTTPLPAPFLGCGVDPTPDSLGCISFNACP